MIKQRIVSYKDDNGNNHFKCQWKGWYFWHFYKSYYYHGFGFIETFATEFDAKKHLEKRRSEERNFIGYIYGGK